MGLVVRVECGRRQEHGNDDGIEDDVRQVVFAGKQYVFQHFENLNL